MEKLLPIVLLLGLDVRKGLSVLKTHVAASQFVAVLRCSEHQVGCVKHKVNEPLQICTLPRPSVPFFP